MRVIWNGRSPRSDDSHNHAAYLLLFSKNSSETLGLLSPGSGVRRNLDQHVRLGDVERVVAHLAQEDRIDSRVGLERMKDPRTLLGKILMGEQKGVSG